MTKLADIVKIDMEKYRIYAPEDFLNESLQLTSFEWKEGPYGAFIQMQVNVPRIKKTVLINSGARGIRDIIEAIPEEVTDVIDFTFRRSGRRVYME